MKYGTNDSERSVMSINMFIKSIGITLISPAMSLGTLVNAASALPAPNAPTNVVATAANAQITVTWDAATTSGAAVTGYKVLLSHTVGSGSVSATCSTTTARTCVFAELTNGTTYIATVEAKSSSETSPASAKVSAMPFGASRAPGIYRLIAQSGAFELFISAPASTGGAAISTYQYSLTGGDTWRTLPMSAVVTGLKHRTVYTVYVRALNKYGMSAKSNPARVTTR